MSINLVRDGIAHHVARHIEVLCATADPGPWRLVRGNANEIADAIVRRWKEPAIRVFALLLQTSALTTKAALAKSLRLSRSTVNDVWRDTLAHAAIEVHVGSDTEPTRKRIFRRGSERKASPEGLLLTLHKSPIAFADLQRIYFGNLPIVEAVNEHNAAIVAEVKAHPAKADAERASAKVAARQIGKQLSLVAPKKTGTSDRA